MTDSTPAREQDIDRDDQQALARDTGGDPAASGADAAATTGTGASDEFVGRVAGQDAGEEAGYAEETGAEARAD